MQRAAIAAVAIVAGAGLMLTGCSTGDAATSSPDPAASPAPTATAPPTVSPTPTPPPTPTETASPAPPVSPTPTPPPTPTETASPAPPAPPPVTPTPEPPPAPPPPPPAPKTTWARGDSGTEVEAIQQKLRDLGYRPGPVDGSYGAATASAVLAFQKREGIGRDGRAGPQTLGRLDAPQGAGPRSADGPAIEVDLGRQIAFVMDGTGAVATLNVSTGNGERYTRPPEAGGGTGVANTPVGSYSVQRRIDGWRDGPLGLMYKPMYFKGGFAVHGSHSVPAYPASHGCVRVSIADSEWVWNTIPNRAPVTLYR